LCIPHPRLRHPSSAIILKISRLWTRTRLTAGRVSWTPARRRSIRATAGGRVGLNSLRLRSGLAWRPRLSDLPAVSEFKTSGKFACPHEINGLLLS
jgi:hypothetical protein